MRYLCVILISLAACTGCRSGAPKATTAAASWSDRFPIVPPIADADPTVRHPVPARVPTAMLVVRHGDSLTISFPTFETTNLMVGYKMVTGSTREERVFHDGITQPAGMSLQGGLAFEPSTNILTFGRDGIPQSGHEFTLEYRATMFETDLPAQHMWSPQSRKHYRVLWTRTFRETVR